VVRKLHYLTFIQYTYAPSLAIQPCWKDEVSCYKSWKPIWWLVSIAHARVGSLCQRSKLTILITYQVYFCFFLLLVYRAFEGWRLPFSHFNPKQGIGEWAWAIIQQAMRRERFPHTQSGSQRRTDCGLIRPVMALPLHICSAFRYRDMLDSAWSSGGGVVSGSLWFGVWLDVWDLWYELQERQSR